MFKVGQEVILMSLPGRSRVVAVDGDVLTIESRDGKRKQVLGRAVRVVPRVDSVPDNAGDA